MLLCKFSHAIFDFCNFLICIICAFYKYYTVTISAAAPFRITLKFKQYLAKIILTHTLQSIYHAFLWKFCFIFACCCM